MAHLLNLPTFKDSRGNLTVIEKILPFEIKRTYFIYEVTNKRGGHRHKKTIQAFVCIGGSCEVYVNDGANKEIFLLDSPDKCLIVEPKDWHTMDNFSDGVILLVLASEFYDHHDYIEKEY